MPVITLTGLNGCGAIEVGREVARLMEVDYVDRLVLAEAARKIGTSVAAVADRTERAPRVSERVASFLRTVLERSASASPGGDPYFGGIDALLVRDFRDMQDTGTPPDTIKDQQLLAVTSSVIRELAASGRVVFVGRGSHIILKEWPDTLHVRLSASTERRIRRVMERERLDRQEAKRCIAESDKGRLFYYQRFFKVNPQDSQQYHVTLNMDWLSDAKAAVIVTSAYQTVVKP
ncbi:MAG: cytidylate kinase-like family protein [SAR202 cluster bacterium]|nr:cytidylate kinase-like family protein [SAR202 cluster bacterium]